MFFFTGVRLQLLGAIITTLLAVTIILNGLYSYFPMNAGMAGLSLIYSFTIINNLNGFLNALSETEQEMVSVERVLEYCDLPNEFGENVHPKFGVAAAQRKQQHQHNTCCSCLCRGTKAESHPEDLKLKERETTYSLLLPQELQDEETGLNELAKESQRAGLVDAFWQSYSTPHSNQQHTAHRVTLPALSEYSGNGSSFGGRLGSSVLFRVLSRNQDGLVFEEVSMSYSSRAPSSSAGRSVLHPAASSSTQSLQTTHLISNNTNKDE